MIKIDNDLCFIRKRSTHSIELPSMTSFSAFVEKLDYNKKPLLREIFEQANDHGLYYPEISLLEGNFTFRWTNDDKFLTLTVFDKVINYIFGDCSFKNEQVGGFEKYDFSQRLLEISLFYNDEG